MFGRRGRGARGGRRGRGRGRGRAPTERNRIGRPRITGDEQTELILEDFEDYEDARHDGEDVGVCFDSTTVNVIARFGWDSPLTKILEEDAVSVDEARYNAVEEEAVQAQAKAKGKTAGEEHDAETLDAMVKDSVVQTVRARVRRVFNEEWRKRAKEGRLRYPTDQNAEGGDNGAGGGGPGGAGGGGPGGDGPGGAGPGSDAPTASGSGAAPAAANSPAAAGSPGGANPSGATMLGSDLLKIFFEKQPRRMQPHMCWITSKGEDDDFAAEVDARWQEAIEKADAAGKRTPPRVAFKSSVASQRYKLLSEEEKADVLKEVEGLYEADMERWLERRSEEPESPLSAVEFLEATRQVVADLAQFVASRGSAVCAWYTAGPLNATYCSQATVDVPGYKTKLWQEMDPQAFAAAGNAMAEKARVLNDARWSTLAQDAGPLTPRPVEEGGDDEVNAKNAGTSSSAAAAPAPAPAPQAPQAPQAPAAAPPETLAAVPAKSPAAPATAIDTPTLETPAPAPASTPASTAAPAPAAGSTPAAASTPVSTATPVTPAHAAPASAAATTATAAPTPVTSAPGLAVPPPGAAIPPLAAATAIAAATPVAPVPASTLALPAAAGIAGPTPVTGAPAAALAPAPVAPSSLPAPAPATMFLFEDDGADLDAKTSKASDAYDVQRNAATEALSSKVWFHNTKSDDFFQNLKKRMGEGVNVGLACRVALAYLAWEQSSAEEGSLVVSAIERGGALPGYVAEFNKRHWMARWHKKAIPDGKRTPALMDADIAESLTRLWAVLQPATRCDGEGRLTAKADASMDWNGAMSPGEQGIRVLVITLLSWGSVIDKTSPIEAAMWSRMAGDVADVLETVLQQLGAAKKRKLAEDQVEEKFQKTHADIGISRERYAAFAANAPAARRYFDTKNAPCPPWVPAPRRAFLAVEAKALERMTLITIYKRPRDGEVDKKERDPLKGDGSPATFIPPVDLIVHAKEEARIYEYLSYAVKLMPMMLARARDAHHSPWVQRLAPKHWRDLLSTAGWRRSSVEQQIAMSVPKGEKKKKGEKIELEPFHPERFYKWGHDLFY
ncbi:hypothetical protein PENSPDRAFT_694107, partial [Peniophora sp. CONT]